MPDTPYLEHDATAVTALAKKASFPILVTSKGFDDAKRLKCTSRITATARKN